VVCDFSRLMYPGARSRFHFRVPPWLRAKLDTSAPKAEIMRRMSGRVQRYVKKVQKEGEYSYEVSHRQADFDLFYDQMHVPYISNRYQERSVMGSREATQTQFSKGGLLLVKYRDQPIAGATINLRGSFLLMKCLGIHQDQMEHGQRSAFHGLYWYSIDWALRNGLDCIDFGRTRPRLTDGVFEYKRRFGCRFEQDALTSTMWSFVGQTLPQVLQQRLNDLALVAQVGEEYRCVAFTGNGLTAYREDRPARREEILSRAGINGMLFLPTEGKR